MKAIEGTGAQIADTRATTPGLRLLERYAVELGGGYNSRFGLDDGVVVTPNHISILGSVTSAVKSAKDKLGYLHKVVVEVTTENELREAIAAGADVIVIEDLDAPEFARLAAWRERCRVRSASSTAEKSRPKTCVTMRRQGRN